MAGNGGPSRNRTGVQGFAVLCVTTPPSGLAGPAFGGSSRRLSTPLRTIFRRTAARVAWRRTSHKIWRRLNLNCISAIQQFEKIEDVMQDFALARRAMVDSQLRPEGVTDRGLLAAM